MKYNAKKRPCQLLLTQPLFLEKKSLGHPQTDQTMNHLTKTLTLLLMVCLPLMAQAQKPDKNFHIFLCFGQSNMEAGARPAEQDKDFNDPRFQFLAAVNMPRTQREMGKWYTAIPPICREGNNMGPVDFFGRKMIESIDDKYRIGVINVSVAGAKIELWDKDDYKEYIDNERDWMKAIVNQ